MQPESCFFFYICVVSFSACQFLSYRYVLNLINAGQVKFPEGYDTGGGGGSAVEQDNYVNYFKDIETDKIERLYKLFQKDFLLFDYAMPFT